MERAEEESRLPVTRVTGEGGGAEGVRVEDRTQPTPRGGVTGAAKDRAAEKADGEKGAVVVRALQLSKVYKVNLFMYVLMNTHICSYLNEDLSKFFFHFFHFQPYVHSPLILEL